MLVPPRFRDPASPVNVSVALGQPLSLACELAEGRPEPVVEWTRDNGRPLFASPRALNTTGTASGAHVFQPSPSEWFSREASQTLPTDVRFFYDFDEFLGFVVNLFFK